MTTLDSIHDRASGRGGPLGPRRLHDALFGRLDDGSDGAVGLLARFAFLAVLAPHYWHAALTKVGSGLPGIFLPQNGAYAQILPHVMERVGYDVSQVGILGHIVVVVGTYAEFVLPALIVLGLMTRLAALGMIGFIVVQSAVDILFHHVGAEAIGALFDRVPDAAILDQRLVWITLLAMLVLKGGGWLSADRLLRLR